MRSSELRKGQSRRSHLNGSGGTFSSPATVGVGKRSLADIDAELEQSDIDAELEQFSMDAGSAPERICQAHLADQLPNFETHLGPAGSPSRLPAPEGAESSPMPSYNRLRPNDCHRIQNRRRELI